MTGLEPTGPRQSAPRRAELKEWTGRAKVAGALALLCICALAVAGPDTAWHPEPGNLELPLWAGDAGALAGRPEVAKAGEELVAGSHVTIVENVSRPTIAVYAPPPEKNTGTAVIVFPGGGYRVLAIDLEGTEVCNWLVAKGVTCVVLKYRVPDPKLWPEKGAPPPDPYRESAIALEDARRSVALVRSHAAAWHVAPRQIGVLGFSAGGHLVAATSNTSEPESRPDFAVALYPGHLWRSAEPLKLNPNVHVTARTPPTFLLHAEDDPVDDVRNTLAYFVELTRAGVPAELHVYPRGGHAFGLRRTSAPITAWPALVEAWLRQIGMLPEQ